jgi:hypothetical protein
LTTAARTKVICTASDNNPLARLTTASATQAHVTAGVSAMFLPLIASGLADGRIRASANMELGVVRGPNSVALTFNLAYPTWLQGSRRAGLPLFMSSQSAVRHQNAPEKVLRLGSTTALAHRLFARRSLAIASETFVALRRGMTARLAAASRSSIAMGRAVRRSLLVRFKSALSKASGVRLPLAFHLTSLLSPQRKSRKVSARSLATALNIRKLLTARPSMTSLAAVSGQAYRRSLLAVSLAGKTRTSGIAKVGKIRLVGSLTRLAPAFHLRKTRVMASTTGLSAAAGLILRVALGIHSLIALSEAPFSIRKVVGIGLAGSIVMVRFVAKNLRVRALSRIETGGRAIAAYLAARRIIGRASTAEITGTSLMTVHDPITVLCGTNWEFSGPLQDARGDPLNLSGASIVWKLDSVDGSTRIVTLSLNSGIQIVSAPTSTILVKAPASQTAGIAAGTYRDWLIVTLASGDVLPGWTGIIRAIASPA